MSLSGKIVLEKPESYHQMAAKQSPTENVKVPLSCAAEVRTLPAAFSLVETMKDPGSQMPTASYTYTFGMAPVSCGDHDGDY